MRSGQPRGVHHHVPCHNSCDQYERKARSEYVKEISVNMSMLACLRESLYGRYGSSVRQATSLFEDDAIVWTHLHSNFGIIFITRAFDAHCYPPLIAQAMIQRLLLRSGAYQYAIHYLQQAPPPCTQTTTSAALLHMKVNTVLCNSSCT